MTKRRLVAAAIAVCGFMLVVPRDCAAAQPAQVLDDFADAAPWTVVASDGVELHVSETAEETHKSVLRLDIDFVTGAGFAGIRRELPLDLPPNFEVAFSLRGDLPRNNLEFKLIGQGEGGANVWWVNRRAFEFPSDWTRLASRRRHFQFAWGPSDAPLQRAIAIEIVIASAEGGRGTVYLYEITFRRLPDTKPFTG
jgi:hypothetical protein